MILKREMTDEYGFEVFEENSFPLAYLLTFRTFGTWLHGDQRRSVKRDGWNIYGTPRIEADERLEKWMSEEMKQPQFILNNSMRAIVEAAVFLPDQRSPGNLGCRVILAINTRKQYKPLLV